MNRIEFEIASLPKTTNKGGRDHWAKKVAEAKKWKNWVCLAVRETGFCGTPFPKAKLTLTRHSSVEPDFDGLVSSFKHVIDGLVEAAVIPNDKMTFIGQPTYVWSKCSPREGKIQVVVEKVESLT